MSDEPIVFSDIIFLDQKLKTRQSFSQFINNAGVLSHAMMFAVGVKSVKLCPPPSPDHPLHSSLQCTL